MRKADHREIQQAITEGIVFRGAKLRAPAAEKQKTKAKKKAYITGAHGSGSAPKPVPTATRNKSTSMKRIFTLALTLLVLAEVRANDSMYYTTGTHLVPLQATKISLDKEVLSITIQNDGYALVDVLYELTNAGPARTVTMGFEADAPYMGEGFNACGVHPFIEDFSVVMNNRTLPYRNALVRNGCIENEQAIAALDSTSWGTNFPDEDSAYDMEAAVYNAELDSVVLYAYAYYFDAHFQPGKNTIHHRYRYRMSVTVLQRFTIDYKLTPATRWAGGRIGDFTLLINAEAAVTQFCVFDEVFGDQPAYTIDGTGRYRHRPRKPRTADDDEYYDLYYGNGAYTEFSIRGGTVRYHATNFAPTDELHIFSADAFNFAPADIYDTEDKLLEYKLRGDFVADYYDSESNFPQVLYVLPFGNPFFTLPDGRSLPTERVLRNMPFAARGYVFKDKDLQRFFEARWWYVPDTSYVPDVGRLSQHEQEFLNELKRL